MVQVIHAAWAMPPNNPTIAKTVTNTTTIVLFFISPSSIVFFQAALTFGLFIYNY